MAKLLYKKVKIDEEIFTMDESGFIYGNKKGAKVYGHRVGKHSFRDFHPFQLEPGQKLITNGHVYEGV